MDRILVVNASPLILLARIDRLDLLASLADLLIVLEAVIREGRHSLPASGDYQLSTPCHREAPRSWSSPETGVDGRGLGKGGRVSYCQGVIRKAEEIAAHSRSGTIIEVKSRSGVGKSSLLAASRSASEAVRKALTNSA